MIVMTYLFFGHIHLRRMKIENILHIFIRATLYQIFFKFHIFIASFSNFSHIFITHT